MMHRIKLGAVCFSEYEGDYVDFVDFAHQYKLCWIEFKYEYPISEKGCSSRSDKIREKAERYSIGLSVHTRFTGFNIGAIDEKMREESIAAIEESIVFASSINAKYATVHAGFLETREYTPENYELSYKNSIKSLEYLVSFGRERGITICIENGNGFTKSKLKHSIIPSDMKRIRSALNGEIFFTVDFGHGLYFGSDPSYIIEELEPNNVKLSHLHDNVGVADTHSPLGRGILKLDRLFTRYVEGGWSFPLSLEHKSSKDLVESIEFARETMKELGFESCE